MIGIFIFYCLKLFEFAKTYKNEYLFFSNDIYFLGLEDKTYDQCKDFKVDEIKNTFLSLCDKCYYNKNSKKLEQDTHTKVFINLHGEYFKLYNKHLLMFNFTLLVMMQSYFNMVKCFLFLI